jgi:hypothetical protein
VVFEKADNWRLSRGRDGSLRVDADWPVSTKSETEHDFQYFIPISFHKSCVHFEIKKSDINSSRQPPYLGILIYLCPRISGQWYICLLKCLKIHPPERSGSIMDSLNKGASSVGRK